MSGRHLDKTTALAGFTLIEVLVVVAIIALLIAVLIPSLSRARDQTKQVTCASNMHQHLNACIMYGQDYRGNLPRNATQYANNGASWWIDTVLASYDPSGRGVYDLRAIMKRYIGNQMEIFSCPANGGPRLDDPANIEKALSAGYMGAQVMMLYNSTCVFQGTSLDRPWAPKQEWTAGGSPSSVPIVQDEYTASGPGVTNLTKYVFNHGRSSERTNNADIPAYTNYYTSASQAACTGVNLGYLDGHTNWIKNTQRGGTGEWVLGVHWSGSALRIGGSSSTSGVPLTIKVKRLTP
ncbi:MAG: type II secretion system protein [Phycisphaerae bacterium]|nr:type II secretion system protein [Phycisphaerae bacterium]